MISFSFFNIALVLSVIHNCIAEIDVNSPLYLDVTKILESRSTAPADKKCGAIASAPLIFSEEFNEYMKRDPWMKVYPFHESNGAELKKLAASVPNPAIYEVPDEAALGRWKITKNNARSGLKYESFSRAQVLAQILEYPDAFETRNIAVFENVWVDRNAFIVERGSCKAIRQGSCLPRRKAFERPSNSNTIHPFVITLANSWGGTWHFPMEDVLGLTGIDRAILDKAVFHVSDKTPYVMQWMAAYGFPDERVLDGTISARVLLVPQIRCTNPYYNQLMWVKNQLLPRALALPEPGINTTATTTAVTTSDKAKETGGKEGGKLSVLLIERTIRRSIANLEEASKAVETFAREHDLNLILHSDRKGMNTFPSILEQVKRFSQADIVIAPHGAGLLFTAFIPSHACTIEFMEPASTPFSFAHMAYVRNMSYIMADMKREVMDVESIKLSLSKCLAAVKATKQYAAKTV